jgi:hypothetical protein
MEEEVKEVQVEEPAVEEVKAEEVQTEEVAEVPAFEQPRKKTAQERIDELTRKRREAEREAEYWRKAALDKEPAKAEPAKPSGPQRPTLDQFESHEDFVAAAVEWTIQQRESAARIEKEQKEEVEALSTFQKRANKLRAEYDDFDELVGSTPFTPYMRKIIANIENGPAIAYYLGQNREIAETLCRLSPEIQSYEIGKLESKLLLAKSTKKATSAPPPISPVGMGGGTKEKTLSEMTTAEAMEYFKQQDLAKLKKKLGGIT